jgi:hypothetical protein
MTRTCANVSALGCITPASLDTHATSAARIFDKCDPPVICIYMPFAPTPSSERHCFEILASWTGPHPGCTGVGPGFRALKVQNGMTVFARPKFGILANCIMTYYAFISCLHVSQQTFRRSVLTVRWSGHYRFGGYAHLGDRY